MKPCLAVDPIFWEQKFSDFSYSGVEGPLGLSSPELIDRRAEAERVAETTNEKRKNMNDLRSYFAALSKYEGKPVLNLVSRWKPADVHSITSAFQKACDESRIEFDVSSDISAPALGNRVARAFANRVNSSLPRYSVCECPGNGYPDQLLRRRQDGRPFALELKAKTAFRPKDGNRQVLTSASSKLRRYFPVGTPICHLFATILYSKARRARRSRVAITGLRLDFLAPSSPVEVRLEASVSQRLLARSKHAKPVLIPTRLRKIRRNRAKAGSTTAGRNSRGGRPATLKAHTGPNHGRVLSQ